MKTALLSIIILLLWSASNINGRHIPSDAKALTSVYQFIDSLSKKDGAQFVIGILKFLCHPHSSGIIVDIVQYGLEYFEYEIPGKAIGAVGNILLAALTSKDSTDPYATVKGFYRWFWGEVARLLAKTFLD